MTGPKGGQIRGSPLYSKFVFTYPGIKFDLSGGSDATEARMLSHESGYTQVYSNSWGPGDIGFIVEGPGVLARRTLETAIAQVKLATNLQL